MIRKVSQVWIWIKVIQHKFILLTFKAPVTTTAEDIHKYFFIVFQRKLRLDASSESSARQRIHLKHQSLIFFER